jgi:hypothetical protein
MTPGIITCKALVRQIMILKRQKNVTNENIWQQPTN